jgi:tetratricopeptide (TPR) repeat protein
MSASIVGSVVDTSGAPVAGASVLVRYRGNVNRDFQVTTDADGRFVQLGLQQGPYEIIAARAGVGFEGMSLLLNVGQRVEVHLRLVPIAADLADDESAGTDAESSVSAALQAGAAASRVGDHAEAVVFFRQAIRTIPDCHECHHRLGRAYAQLEDYTSAEAALIRAIEIDAEYVRAYRDLADVYEAQERAEDAADLRAKAAALSNPSR